MLRQVQLLHYNMLDRVIAIILYVLIIAKETFEECLWPCFIATLIEAKATL